MASGLIHFESVRKSLGFCFIKQAVETQTARAIRCTRTVFCQIRVGGRLFVQFKSGVMPTALIR